MFCTDHITPFFSYKQEKFNLLREENEGYAKLLVDLCEQCQNKTPHEKALKDILCLIGEFYEHCVTLSKYFTAGQFKLDPNRVTDVVLEVFERSLDQADYLCYLLRALQATSTDICNLLGFKFQPYQVVIEDDFPFYKGRYSNPSSQECLRRCMI